MRPPFPQVPQQRTNSRADLMILLCRGNAWTNARGQVVNVGPNANDAYGVVRIADAANANHTFTHEVGHLFGCRHQIESDPTAGYAHGFRLLNISGQQSTEITVMHARLSEKCQSTESLVE
ncbi:MAG: zinc-dependent metalloprotease [Cytophagaceae bacterium]|nr:zinc-dependent metalloprotease [Cytophagaceae bacterium]